MQSEDLMFGIGLPEMILILALALIVVGPDKLPELARSVAKGVMELKKTVSTLKEDLADDNPFDSVKPELEEAADSIKKQLSEATTEDFTGITKDIENSLQEVIDIDGTVIPISTDDIINKLANSDQAETDTGDSAGTERLAQAAGEAAEEAAEEEQDSPAGSPDDENKDSPPA
jgi:Tat protein translocase TatB subunit